MDKDKDNVEKIISGQVENNEETDSEFLQDFIVEAKEHVENIEMNCLTIETQPDNIESIHSLFRAFHTIKGLAGFVDQNIVQKISHQTETLLDNCRKEKIKVDKTIVDLILNSSDYIKKLCDFIDLNNNKEFLSKIDEHLDRLKNVQKNLLNNKIKEISGENNSNTKKIGEILVEQNKVSEKDIKEMVKKQKENYFELKLGQVLVKENKATASDVINSIRVQEEMKENKKTQTITDNIYMRVQTGKIDNLVDMMGELLIIQSLIEQEAETRFEHNDKFTNNLLRMSRIMREIQNLSMSLRMVSLKSIFQRIVRVGRDTANELKKKVNITVTGEETEIDRNITEKILDPLMHIIRNSISHGIEDEKERKRKGKPIQGEVNIQAYSKRGTVYIEISDDGKGMSIEDIYNKALEKKLIDQSVNYKEDEVIDFVFLPGFSTAEKVNSISGRGVGLDVVRTEMGSIGGKIEIKNYPHKGCTFILKIPINLAVMNGTIVDILSNYYIIPTINVREIIQPTQKQWITTKNKKTMLRLRDDIIPIIPIVEIFNKGIWNEEESLFVIIELEQKLRALPVKSIIGRKEIVVKPLGSEFSNLKFLSGASILGDGRVSLILDIENLFKMEEGV